MKHPGSRVGVPLDNAFMLTFLPTSQLLSEKSAVKAKVSAKNATRHPLNGMQASRTTAV